MAKRVFSGRRRPLCLADHEATPLHDLFGIEPPPPGPQRLPEPMPHFLGEDALARLLNVLVARNEAAQIGGLLLVGWRRRSAEDEDHWPFVMHSGYVSGKQLLRDAGALVERLRAANRVRLTVHPGGLRRRARAGAVVMTGGLLRALHASHRLRPIEAAGGVVYGSDGSRRFFSEGIVPTSELKLLRDAMAIDISDCYWREWGAGDFSYEDRTVERR